MTQDTRHMTHENGPVSCDMCHVSGMPLIVTGLLVHIFSSGDAGGVHFRLFHVGGPGRADPAFLRDENVQDRAVSASGVSAFYDPTA